MDSTDTTLNKVYTEYLTNGDANLIYDASIIKYGIDLDKHKYKTWLEGYISFEQLYGSTEVKRAVKFKRCDENEAKQIYSTSSTLVHGSLLKIWFVTYNRRLRSWICCYDQFDFTLDNWWSNKEATPYKEVNDDQTPFVSLWMRDTIKELIMVVKYIHNLGIVHGSLSETKNYVVANGNIKLLDVEGRAQAITVADKYDDMKNLATMLQAQLSYIPGSLYDFEHAISLERNAFLDAFIVYPHDTVYDKLEKHPFLLDAEGRFQIYCRMQRYYEARNSNFPEFVKSINRFVKFANWKAQSLSPRLNFIYNGTSSGYYANAAQPGHVKYQKSLYCVMKDLIRYLRNVYEHSPDHRYDWENDVEVMLAYPGFIAYAYDTFE